MIDQGVPGRSLRGLRLSLRARRRRAAGRAATAATATGSRATGSRATRSPATGSRATRSPAARSRSRGRAARRGRLTGRPLRFALIALAVAGLLAGGWIWLRDSPLVSVDKVTITGLSGPEAPRIRTALTLAARGMTTLDVREATLRAAVSPYPVVKGLSVSSAFPHGLRIAVQEQLPVAAVTAAGRSLPVAADGTVLHDGEASGALPTLAVKSVPGGSTIEDPIVLLQLRVLGAAPSGMLARVASVSTDYWHGVVVDVHNGPSVYFGGGGQLAAKWQAALSVLAAPSTAGASYIDVTDPQRPAAGSGTASSSSSSSSSGTSGATNASATSPSTAGGAATTAVAPGATTASTSSIGGGG